MGLFFRGNNDNENYDFDRLRKDLVEEYGIQSASFSGGLGFLDMCDAESASNEQLIELARKEGFNLSKYQR